MSEESETKLRVRGSYMVGKVYGVSGAGLGGTLWWLSNSAMSGYSTHSVR